jgi:copper transport protein
MKHSFLHVNRPVPLAILVGLLLVLVFRPAAAVFAHSDNIRAEPSQNSVLPQAPDRVIIWFTESLETRFGEIQVLDAAGQHVDNGDSAVDPQDRTKMTVTLPPLPNGTYTVVWTNVSTVDGHRVRGSYLFSIGEPIGAVVLPVLADQPLLQSPLEPIFRWLSLLSIMAIVGGLVFQVSVLRPALAVMKPTKATDQLSQELMDRARLLNWVAIGLFFLASIGHLVLQVSITFELGLLQSLGQPLAAMLIETNWGKLWLARMILALALAVLLWRTTRSTRDSSPAESGSLKRPDPLELAVGALGLLILITITLTSHAAATEDIRLAATFNDYLHMVAAAVWVGGLFHFAPTLPLIRRDLPSNQQKRLLASMVPRFSILGITTVAVMVVTGLYSAWAQVTRPIALTTPYGRVLMVKVGLVGLILALAAANLIWVRPRLAKDLEAGRQLRRLVTAEAALALVILLAVGLLTALEPARQVSSRQSLGQEELVFSETIDGLGVELAITPGQVGLNQIMVTLSDPDSQRSADTADVTLRPAFLENDLGAQPVSAANVDDGQYQADDMFLNLPGLWQIALTARLPGSSDVRTAFRFDLGQASLEDSSTISPDAGTGQFLWAAEIALLGLALLVIGVSIGRRRRRGILTVLSGIAAVIIAVFLALTAQSSKLEVAQAALPAADVNPFLPDNDSVGQGQHVYEDHCMICHGLTGHGDGPRSAGIDAVDIIEHVPLHADVDYFEIVTAHKERGDLAHSTGEISDDNIWHLVNYLHAFETDQLLAEVYFSQARDLAEQGDSAGALAGLNQAIELSPRFVQALQGRGIIYLDQGKFVQALDEFDQIIALDPSFPDSYYYRAEASRYVERWPEAINDYTQAISLEPNRSQAYYGRALAYAEAGQPGEAIADLQYYLTIAPTADQALVEQLIAELQGSPAQSADGRAPSFTLNQSDLPAGFEELPALNLGLAEGKPISIGTVIARSFAFGHRDHFELVWGYSTPLLSENDQAAFDDQLNETALLAFLSDGLGTENIGEASTLSAPPELGSASTKIVVVFDSDRQRTRVEGLAFRRDDLGILLFIASDDGITPTSMLDSLARILLDRAES